MLATISWGLPSPGHQLTRPSGGWDWATFALMTSDSDFTPLVLRILESGLPVYGFGEEKTPDPFVDGCSTFIYTENLVAAKDDAKQGQPAKQMGGANLRKESKLVNMLRSAVEQTSDDDDWALLSKVGSYISNNSSLSPVNYGFKKWSDLVRAIELFDVDMRQRHRQTQDLISQEAAGVAAAAAAQHVEAMSLIKDTTGAYVYSHMCVGYTMQPYAYVHMNSGRRGRWQQTQPYVYRHMYIGHCI